MKNSYINTDLYKNTMSKRTEQMAKIQEEAFALFTKKNKDYGDAFATYGSVGVIVRIGDKINRYHSITRRGVSLVDSESLRDTLIDLHNYAAMAIMLLDEKPQNRSIEKVKEMDQHKETPYPKTENI